MHTVNVLTVATSWYRDLVTPFIFFAGKFNSEASFEIYVQNFDDFMQEKRSELNYLTKFYNIHIGNADSYKKYNVTANQLRFIIEPKIWSEYTYISDVDIIILENIIDRHLPVIKSGKDYSNMVRPGTKKLTGLHFVKTHSHYPLPKLKRLLKKFKNDEDLLYAIAHKKGYLQNDTQTSYRPGLGLHMSLNRFPLPLMNLPGWDITKKRLDQMKEIVIEDDFKYLYEISSDSSKMALNNVVFLTEAASTFGSTDINLYKKYIHEYTPYFE